MRHILAILIFTSLISYVSCISTPSPAKKNRTAKPIKTTVKKSSAMVTALTKSHANSALTASPEKRKSAVVTPLKVSTTEDDDEDEPVASTQDLIAYCPLLSPYRSEPPIPLKQIIPFSISSWFIVDHVIGVDDVGQTVQVSGNYRLLWNVNSCPTKSKTIAVDLNKRYNYAIADVEEIWHPPVQFRSSSDDVGMANNFFHTVDAVLAPKGAGTSPRILFTWSRRGIFETRCALDLSRFPFDKQTCNFDFCLLKRSKRILFKEEASAFEIKSTGQTSSQWISTTNETTFFLIANDVNNDDDTMFSCVRYPMVLERRPDFFVTNMMAPCLLMVILNIFTFLIPPGTIDRVALNVSLVMSVSVFVTVVINYLPQTPQRVFLADFTQISTLFCGTCTVQSIVLYWFAATSPKKAEKRCGCAISCVRLLDIFCFFCQMGILGWLAFYVTQVVLKNN